MASSLQQPLFLVSADSPFIHFYFNLSTTATNGKGH